MSYLFLDSVRPLDEPVVVFLREDDHDGSDGLSDETSNSFCLALLRAMIIIGFCVILYMELHYLFLLNMRERNLPLLVGSSSRDNDLQLEA
jgi:hypothetical protein